MRWIARGARDGSGVGARCGSWPGSRSSSRWRRRCRELAQQLSGTGRRLRLGATRVRPRARVHLRLVPLGQQPVLLSVACCSSAPRTSRRWAADGGRGVGASRWYSVTFVLAGIWIAAGVNILGLRMRQVAAERRQPRRLGSGRPPDRLRRARARALRIRDAVHGRRRWCRTAALLDTLGLWSAMCFAFSGFEITSFIGQEIHNPRRTIPQRHLHRRRRRRRSSTSSDRRRC